MNGRNKPNYYQGLIGKRYGRLIVLEVVSGRRRKQVRCVCDCGNTRVVYPYNLTSGSTTSCGCLQKEKAAERSRLRSNTKTLLDKAIYKRWRAMKKRCSPSAKHCRHNYIERGIAVCEEWANGPVAFIKWSKENGYEGELELDRIDNNKGYFPDNCRYVTRRQQARNRRTNIHVEYNNERMTLIEFYERHVSHTVLHAAYSRHAAGWTPEEIIAGTKI